MERKKDVVLFSLKQGRTGRDESERIAALDCQHPKPLAESQKGPGVKGRERVGERCGALLHFFCAGWGRGRSPLGVALSLIDPSPTAGARIEIGRAIRSQPRAIRLFNEAAPLARAIGRRDRLRSRPPDRSARTQRDVRSSSRLPHPRPDHRPNLTLTPPPPP